MWSTYTFIWMGVLIAMTITSSLTNQTTAAASLNGPTCQAMSEEHAGWNLQPVPHAYVPPGYCASIYATGLGTPRGMTLLPHGHGLLVVDSSTGEIHWLNDTNRNGMIDTNSTNEHQVILQQNGLNHGIAIWSNHSILLASSVNTVYGWVINLNQPNQSLAGQTPQIIVQHIPGQELPDQGHITRTLLIDPTQSWLYVSVGNGTSNVDTSPDRDLIKRFQLTLLPTNGTGFDYAQSGEVFAAGLRNEVGIQFDKYGVLWGVENGADELHREDLGGDIHNDNPAEEINKFDTPGKFYGYPYCWSEYKLPTYGLGPGTQWSWPSFMSDGVHNDSWCRNLTNNRPPVYNLQAHAAPLGMVFYNTTGFGLSTAPFTFPVSPSNRSYLYVPQHGSWDRDTPVGYRIQRIEVIDSGTDITLASAGTEEDFFKYDSPNATSSDWLMRPVDVIIGQTGELYLSNDLGGNIVVIRYLQDWSNASIIANTTNSTTPTTSSSSQLSIYSSYILLYTLLIPLLLTITL